MRAGGCGARSWREGTVLRPGPLSIRGLQSAEPSSRWRCYLRLSMQFSPNPPPPLHWRGCFMITQCGEDK